MKYKIHMQRVVLEEGHEANYKIWHLVRLNTELPGEPDEEEDYDKSYWTDLGEVSNEEIEILKKFKVL